MKLTSTVIALFLVLASGPAPAQAPAVQEAPARKPSAQNGIVPHPSQLEFPELKFDPPDAASHRHVLPSGVVVFVVEDHELPLVDIQVLVRAGGYLDPPGKEGLADLVSEQLRAGGTEAMSADDFDEEADFLAAKISTSSTDTDASASMNCLTRNRDRVLEMFFAMLRTPRFDEKRLALAKSQWIQNLARRNDETTSIESREWSGLLWGRDRFTFDRVTKQSVERITREDLLAFHRKYYHPGNLILAVSGDVGTDAILRQLEDICAQWPGDASARAKAPPPPPLAHEPVPGLYLVDKPDVNQGRVRLGHLSVKRDCPDYHALLIMNHILGGGGFTSRIMARVRSDEGLAYSAGSRLNFGIYAPGDFRAFFQSKSPSVAQAVSIVLEEIEKIRTTPVEEEELKNAVNYAVGIFPRFFATSKAVASTFARDEFTGRAPDFWKTYREKIKAVTVESVQQAARRYLHPDRLVILIVGNAAAILKGNEKAGKDLLEKFAGKPGIQRIPLPDPLTMRYP